MQCWFLGGLFFLFLFFPSVLPSSVIEHRFNLPPAVSRRSPSPAVAAWGQCVDGAAQRRRLNSLPHGGGAGERRRLASFAAGYQHFGRSNEPPQSRVIFGPWTLPGQSDTKPLWVKFLCCCSLKIMCHIPFQASMEVDGKLRDSKLKTVSVGGVARPDGKIQHGFRGCIQVCLFGRPRSYLPLWLCLKLDHIQTISVSSPPSEHVFYLFSCRVCVLAELWACLRPGRWMWSRAAVCPTPAAPTPVLSTATAVTTGTATPAPASMVSQRTHSKANNNDRYVSYPISWIIFFVNCKLFYKTIL